MAGLVAIRSSLPSVVREIKRRERATTERGAQVRGRIQSTKPSQSGKTLGVQIDGTWYSSKNFDLQNYAGKEIVADTSESEYKGQTIRWINSYTLVDGAPPVEAQEAQGATNGTKAMSPYQPLVSNLAAHLIAAGKEPGELRAWYVACKEVLEQDPEIPF
jgi:hypothetical protein